MSSETLISSRLKMFQNSGGKPPPLPVKPTNINVTASQAKTVAKFVKSNVKVHDVVTAMQTGSEIYAATKSNNNNNTSNINNNRAANERKPSGKVLATAKFLETALPVVQQQQQQPQQQQHQNTDITNFGINYFQTPTTSAVTNFTNKPLPSLPPHPPPTVVKTAIAASGSSNRNSWNSGKIKELTSKLQETSTVAAPPPTVVKPRPDSSNFDSKNSVKNLKADLESKLSFGPPTVVYNSNRRRSSSSQNQQDFNANFSQQQRVSVSYHSELANAAENANSGEFSSTMVPVLPVQSKMPSPGRPPAPKIQQHEPQGVVLYDFDSQQEDELNCRAGERIILKYEVDDEWLCAFNPRTQRTGIVPKGYVEIKTPFPLAPKSPTTINSKTADVWDDDSGVDSAHDGPRCYTLHDFNSGESGDLAFCQGEIIRLIARVNVEWLEGEAHDGRRGIFPASFVEIIEDLPSGNNSPRPQSEFIANNERIRSPDISSKPLIAIALYDFDGPSEGDLPFVAGEQIEVINVVNEEWSQGVSLSTGKSGIFPSNFVEYIPDDQISSPMLPPQHPPLPPIQQDTLVGKIARALYDYKSNEKQDLNFQAGDEIEVIKVLDGNWMEGRLVVGLSNKRCWPVGLFPRNYVQF